MNSLIETKLDDLLDITPGMGNLNLLFGLESPPSATAKEVFKNGCPPTAATTTTPRAAAEHVEDVCEVIDVDRLARTRIPAAPRIFTATAAGRGSISRIQTGMAELVVTLPLVFFGKDVVCLL